MPVSDTTIAVQRYLDELVAIEGDQPAEPVVRKILARSVDRLQLLCGAMLHHSYPRLTRGPANLSTEELLGAIVERLIKAMRDVRPTNVRHFFALANQHIRWELNDLARQLDKHTRAAGLEEWHAAPAQPETDTGSRANALRILEAIDKLPEEEREAFNLVRLQGMTKAEAAGILGVSEKTVQRRVSRSVMMLAEALRQIVPQSMLETRGEGEHFPGSSAP